MNGGAVAPPQNGTTENNKKVIFAKSIRLPGALSPRNGEPLELHLLILHDSDIDSPKNINPVNKIKYRSFISYRFPRCYMNDRLH